MNNTMCNIFTRTAIDSAFVIGCIWVLSGCLANPTPHPGRDDFESAALPEPGSANMFEEGDASHSSIDVSRDISDVEMGDEDVTDGVDCEPPDDGGPLNDMRVESALDCGPRAPEEPQG